MNDNITNLIDAISSLLASDNKIISIITSITLIILMTSIVSITVLDIVKKYKDILEILFTKIKRNNDIDEIKTKVKLDVLIQDMLSDAAKQTNSDRVMLFQFHNGTEAKSGMKFENVVLTHEFTKPGIAENILVDKHYDIRLFVQLLSDAFENEHNYAIYNYDEINEPVKSFLNENGDRKIFIKLILSVSYPKTTVGFLVFSKMNDDFEWGTNINTIAETIGNMCAGAICVAYGDCDYCKYKFNKNKCTKKMKEINMIKHNCINFQPMIMTK